MKGSLMRKFIASAAVATVAVSGIAFASSAAAVQPSKKYTPSQVAKHKTATDCWSIVGKGVYNLTSYVNKHPGGASKITAICGKNGTSAFNGQHSGASKPASVLKSYKIGTVK